MTDKLIELLKSTDSELVQFTNMNINMLHSHHDPLEIRIEYDMLESVLRMFYKYIDALVKDQQLVDTNSGEPLKDDDIGIRVSEDDTDSSTDNFGLGFDSFSILGNASIPFVMPRRPMKHVYVDLNLSQDNMRNVTY